MAVRKIPKNYLVVTGSFASQKNDQMNEFESILEKEHMLLLEFDQRIDRFETQSITIPIPGVPKGYTPDALIHYLPDPETGEVPKSALIEVKHTNDLERNKEKYRKKFSEAANYADARGWEFRIVTQNDIRTPRLENLKFLRTYRNVEMNDIDHHTLIRMVKKLGDQCTPKSLIEGLASNTHDQLYWLPLVWRAILFHNLVIDWNQTLTNDSTIQLGGMH